MTGGGNSTRGTFRGEQVKVTHGFTLRCRTDDHPQRLEVNWSGGNKFHLVDLTFSRCTDTALDEENPKAGFDTYEGRGYGRDGAYAEWTFTDAGEPGRNDGFKISIWSDGTKDGAAGSRRERHPAHRRQPPGSPGHRKGCALARTSHAVGGAVPLTAPRSCDVTPPPPGAPHAAPRAWGVASSWPRSRSSLLWAPPVTAQEPADPEPIEDFWTAEEEAIAREQAAADAEAQAAPRSCIRAAPLRPRASPVPRRRSRSRRRARRR